MVEPPVYRSLAPDKIVETSERLLARIRERFPESSLGKLAEELVAVTRRAAELSEWLARPHWPLRVAVGTCLLAMLLVVVGLGRQLQVEVGRLNLSDLLQGLEAGINDLVFLGVGIFFLVSWETRIKRNKVLKAVHELRSLAHVIDMHQLTKDPENLVADYTSTASSPQRTMTPFELTRYLDYCSECLSLISKVAAVYVQDFQDPATLSAVNDVESLTTGLSRKIWHKIVILDRMLR
jgi:hypothetical protein